MKNSKKNSKDVLFAVIFPLLIIIMIISQALFSIGFTSKLIGVFGVLLAVILWAFFRKTKIMKLAFLIIVLLLTQVGIIGMQLIY